MEDLGRQSRIVLRDAIAMELDGKEFFERASRQMTRKRAKDMFLGLVAQENRHIEVLSNELRLLEGGHDWAALDDVKRLSGPTSVPSVFSDKRITRSKLKPDAGEVDVIDLGIEVEKKSIEYYKAAGQQTENQNAKQVFNWLVGEESGHLTILQAERDSRSGSGFHYGSAEFSLETQ